MKFNFLAKSLVVTFIIILLASCDKDYNQLGADIVGNDHYGLDSLSSDVVAYNQALGPVQTNNLPTNLLGYYNNSVFGKTKASFLTQVTLAVYQPTFYHVDASKIDSVYLYVPYFSRVLATDTDSGNSTFQLDSIQGANKIKLSIFECTKPIENFDPNQGFTQQQRYYSDQQSDFDPFLGNGGIRLNDTSDASENDQFEFKSNQIIYYKNKADGTPGTPGVDAVRERANPGMFVNLNKNYFYNKIFNTPASNRYNADGFKNYFRGLYFKVDNTTDSPDQGALARMNFSQGRIYIVYKDDTSATDVTQVKKTLILNLSGNSINFYNNNFNSTYTTAVSNPNTTSGDEKLYLKGGSGSMAVIKLFGGYPNGTSSELNDFRSKNILINDASLSFYIDKTAMASTTEPNRIYLYDLTNHRPIIDYFYDSSTSTSTKYNKFIHGGIIKKKSGDAKGYVYKVRITNYLRSLVKNGNVTNVKDTTNVRLGLVVTENILNASSAYLKSPFNYLEINPLSGMLENKSSKYIPVMSVINPLGTVLYGTNSNVPDDKKIKLEVYYTKPD